MRETKSLRSGLGFFFFIYFLFKLLQNGKFCRFLKFFFYTNFGLIRSPFWLDSA